MDTTVNITFSQTTCAGGEMLRLFSSEFGNNDNVWREGTLKWVITCYRIAGFTLLLGIAVIRNTDLHRVWSIISNVDFYLMSVPCQQFIPAGRDSSFLVKNNHITRVFFFKLVILCQIAAGFCQPASLDIHSCFSYFGFGSC